MLVLRKASGIVRFWEGWCGSKGIEIDRSANIKASEALTIPTVTARNSFRIVKVGLSEYCTASQKIISAVPPPLFRGEARVIVLGKSTAKPTERSYGKGVGNFRGIVRFWKGWFEMKNGGTIPPVVARIFFGRQDLTFDKGGKCDSVFRGIVRFWKGWFGMKNGGTIPPVVARIFSGDST